MTAIDTRVARSAPGTLHRNLIFVRITLAFHQTSDLLPERVLLGTLEVESDAFVAYQEDGPVPLGLAWNEDDIAPGSVSQVIGDRPLRSRGFTRSMAPGHTLRSRGGRSYDRPGPDARHDRGGYAFAPSDTPDDALHGPAGAGRRHRLLQVKVRLNQGRAHPLLLRYPDSPRAGSIYQAHTFRLGLTLTVGNSSWEIPGPRVLHPAYEFPHDAGQARPALRKALIAEYGNPAVKPPLHPRDHLRYIDAGHAIGAALRAHVTAAADHVTLRLPGDVGFTVSALEVAATLLAEGAVGVLGPAIRQGLAPERLQFAGYEELGLDSFVTRWRAGEGHLRDYTRSDLAGYAQNPSDFVAVREDEQWHSYTTFAWLSLEEAAFATAALYAFFKERFARAVADPAVLGPWATPAESLPLHLQFYWSTFYFNTSSGQDRGTPRLKDRWLEYHDLPWLLQDDPLLYQNDGRYNAAWRTATFRWLAALGGL